VPDRLVQFVYKRLQMGTLARRLADAAVWCFAGAVAARAISIVSSVFVARVLGTEGFGQYGTIQSTVMMFGTFAGFGLGLTATKHVAEYRQNDPAKAGRILGLSAMTALCSGAVVTAVLLAGAPWLAASTLAAPHLSRGLRIGALLVLFTALNGSQNGALVGLEAFRLIARLNLITGLASLPLVVGGVFLFGLEGALLGLTVASFVTWVCFHWGLRRELARRGIPFRLKGSFQEIRLLWTFSIPAVISGMLAAPVTWACNALLVNQPNGYIEMGIANAANQWFYALLFLPGILARSSIAILSERLGSADRPACRKIILYGIALNTAVVIPLVLIGCLASRYIMGIYGPGFAEHPAVLMVAIVAGAVVAIQVPMGQTTAASGRMWIETLMNLGWALAFFTGTWLTVSQGALGLMSARLGAYVLHTAWTIAFVLWLLRDRRLLVPVPVS
jgi:O-antigen/teichoic acid export membrane protein